MFTSLIALKVWTGPFGRKINVIENIFIGLKPDKVKHIVCGRSHTIVSTGNLYTF